MRSKLSFAALLLGLWLLAPPAQAQQRISPKNLRGVMYIDKGVYDLGFENLMLVNSMTSTQEVGGISSTVSSLYARYVARLTPRYFVADNLSLGLDLSLFYGKAETTIENNVGTTASTSNDLGFMGLLTANYHLRLGHGLFFRPGVGAGVMSGQRDTPSSTPGVILRSSLTGGVVKLDLGFVYYAGPSFNMRAGPEVNMRYGAETFEGTGETKDFVGMDAGVSMGIGYSF